MKQRVVFGWITFVILLAVIFAPPFILYAVLGLVSILAIYEVAKVAGKKNQWWAIDLYLIILLSSFCFVSLRQLEHGLILIWFIFFATVPTDTGAYFGGMFFGKHKLAPSISPKKTVEGAICGIICCEIVYLVYYYILQKFGIYFDLKQIMLYGLGASVVAQLGDLAASSFKRKCGVKDFSSLIPGHGGIMDRIDSFLFVSIFIFFMFK